MKKTCFYSWIVIMLLISKGNIFAQQDAQFSQYMFLNSYINPASCGINNTTDAAFIYRYQWAGNNPTNPDDVSGSPQSQMLTASTKIRQLNSGIGLFIVNDQTAIVNNVNANLSYAYHVDLSQDVKLSFGIRAGLLNQQINTKWRSNDPIESDPILRDIRQNSNSLKLDFGGGLWLNSPTYFVGISMAHINKPALFANDFGISYIYRYGYITGGYNFRLNERWVLTPSAFIKSDLLKFSQTQIDLSALAHLNSDQFWGGLSYRSGEAMIALVGIGLLKDHSLKVGFAFDLIVSGSSAKAGTSYEVMLTYSKPVADIIPRPIIRTPRFRY